jgi:hypothetical protein
MFNDWTEKDLQEYYNSAIGVDIKAPLPQAKASVEEEEVVEVIETPKKTVKKEEPVVEEVEEVEEVKLNPPVTDEDDLESLIVTDITSTSKEEPVQDTSLDEFDTEDDDFFED